MDQEHEFESRLSHIETNWAKLLQSQSGGSEDARQAQKEVLQRYNRAIFRYLLKGAGDMDVAEELFQEFALRFIRGDFDTATPERGRFRHFLKRSLGNLLIDHHRKKQRQLAPLSAEHLELAEERSDVEGADVAFTQSCRDELLHRTWKALAACDKLDETAFHEVLRVRTDNPDVHSPELAIIVSQRLGKTVTAEWVRNRLHFARKKFTELLLAEIEKTLATPNQDDLEHEVIDLGLLDYCLAALNERRAGR
jgi:DNA-directed RNA polymerase specialized sigma24 family protein